VAEVKNKATCGETICPTNGSSMAANQRCNHLANASEAVPAKASLQFCPLHMAMLTNAGSTSSMGFPVSVL